MTDAEPSDALGLITPEEVSSLASYIKRKNTAVLTVMFTDIQGFTDITEEKGERYSRDLRKHHDAILVSAIEDDGAGLVIKFIGDAVMAVFSEPSAAVEAALVVQREIRAFNEAHPDLDDLHVRIGLHMGQVAVEENLQTDVFGRHVNRAARIESLAAGGQVYMSDPVMDSARGWLAGQEHLAWTAHGHYHLKGIDKPVEIHEVCDARAVTPAPPRRGTRKRDFPRRSVAVGLVLLGALGAGAALMFQRTVVWLESPYPEDLRVDAGERVSLDGRPEDAQRRVLSPLPAGTHVLYYDVERVRYYAEVEVERGENFIKPRFRESRLPTISLRTGVKESPTSNPSRARELTFFYYDAESELVTRTLELAIDIESRLEGAEAHHAFTWRIEGDGLDAQSGTVSATQAVEERKSTRVAPVVVIDAPPIQVYYRYYTLREFAEFTLGTRFSGPPF